MGLVTFVALLVQVYSLEYMRGDSRFGWYFAVHSLFGAAMLALVLADNLLFLYIAWELVGLGSYLLIGHWWERRSAAEAAKKAFITTRIGDVGLLIGIILLFRATGTFDISEIIEMAQAGAIGQGTLTASALLLFMGAMGKSAQFPFHVWLPDAMEGPTPVSALIHAATMVAAGVYLVARMLPMFELVPVVMLVVAVIGLDNFPVRRHARTGDDRHQARSSIFHDKPPRADDALARRIRTRRRHLPSRRARRIESDALPRRGQRDARNARGDRHA